MNNEKGTWMIQKSKFYNILIYTIYNIFGYQK